MVLLQWGKWLMKVMIALMGLFKMHYFFWFLNFGILFTLKMRWMCYVWLMAVITCSFWFNTSSALPVFLEQGCHLMFTHSDSCLLLGGISGRYNSSHRSSTGISFPIHLECCIFAHFGILTHICKLEQQQIYNTFICLLSAVVGAGHKLFWLSVIEGDQILK